MIRLITIAVLLILLIKSDTKQDQEIIDLKESISTLKTQMKLNEHKSTFGELEDIQPKHRALVMAIAITESNGCYNVKHPTDEVVGIGGIKPSQWTLKSNINSLKAIEEIVVTLEPKGKKPYEIIKAYKGCKANYKSTEQCWDLYQRLKNVL